MFNFICWQSLVSLRGFLLLVVVLVEELTKRTRTPNNISGGNQLQGAENPSYVYE